MNRLAFPLMLLALGMAALGWQQGWWRLPNHLDPLAPLRVEAPPNWLTGFKLARAQRDPARCEQLVRALPWRPVALPDRRTGEGCGFQQAWRIEALGGGVQVGDAFPLSCPAVLALAMWQRHSVEPAAQRHFGEPLQRLQHVGSYACRNVGRRETGARSRHATAEALDVTAFVLGGGRHVSVQGGWAGTDEAGAFLREVHDGACRWFDGTLGPGYDAAHRDHFHLEVGGWRSCR